MSIKIKSVCLNQPSDSFLYISSFCPPLYSRSTLPRKIFFREILRLSSSKVRHIYYIGLYNIILHLQNQVKYHICQKQTFFTVWCQSLSLGGEAFIISAWSNKSSVSQFLHLGSFYFSFL